MFRLLKNISTYSLANVIRASISFLLLPLYTRVLTPSDYGELELLNLLAAILGILFGFIISSGYGRLFFDAKDETGKKILFFTGQLFTLLCAVLLTLLILTNIDWFSVHILNANVSNRSIILITSSTIFFVLTKIPLTNLQIRQLPIPYVLVSIAGLLVTVTVTIVMVVIYKYGVLGVLYGQLIGNIIQFAILFYLTRQEIKFGFSWIQLGLMLSFSIFLIPANLSSLVLNMSNRWFLQEYQTLGDVGLFSLGAKFAAIIPMLFTEPIKLAFGPYLFSLIENPSLCKRTLGDFSRIMFIGLSIVVIIISLFTREAIMLIADKSFYGSQNVTFVLSISYLFLGLSGIIVLGIQIVRKTWIITLIWVLSSIINILLNLWLIPLYGRMGAAFATLISVVLICSSYFFAVSKIYPVRFNYISFIFVLVLTLIINYLGAMVNFGVAASLLVKIALLSVYIASLFLFGLIRKSELVQIKHKLLYRH